MTTSLIHCPDAMGTPTGVITAPGHVMAVTLAAGVAKQVTVPAGAKAALFSGSDLFWARVGGAAAVPNGDILDGSAPELMPAARQVSPGQTIGLAAPAACVVSISFYG